GAAHAKILAGLVIVLLTAMIPLNYPPLIHSILFFFFQAEDGIRDYKVTGVQTCALPIFHLLGGGHTYVLPQPPNTSMTCHWAISSGVVHLAIAADTLAALWTLHERRSD